MSGNTARTALTSPKAHDSLRRLLIGDAPSGQVISDLICVNLCKSVDEYLLPSAVHGAGHFHAITLPAS
jgi:hypothetical protein